MTRLSSAPGTIERPDLDDRGLEAIDPPYIVTVFDNDYNTVVEVITILMIATQCDLEEAQMETWEIHHLGRSVVHRASFEDCLAAAEIIRTIGIHVEVTCDA